MIHAFLLRSQEWFSMHRLAELSDVYPHLEKDATWLVGLRDALLEGSSETECTGTSVTLLSGVAVYAR